MSRLFAQSALRAAFRDAARQPGFTTRSFSSLPGLRPSTSTPSSSIFTRRPTALLPSIFTPTPTTAAAVLGDSASVAADIVPTSAITSNPALAGIGCQIRCGPRNYMNMNRPSRLIRQRRHGFLSRIRTKNGRKMLLRRKSKGRKTLSA
ncbi:hypothetical protein VMCG_04597 [Cytospora schulzeri]|uniref:Ribosomal protein L34 n=1 Tax=Cytospora schulzeri TaxID=448051 RepID=A0A423WRW4_9PEZI|nr:hypothetical protein VMCG_04597 [Valsa malicola]